PVVCENSADRLTGLAVISVRSYLDARALVKLLVPEPESDDLNRALIGLIDVIVSDLALTEVASALGRRVRDKRLTRDSAQRLSREAGKLHASAHRAELTRRSIVVPGG